MSLIRTAVILLAFCTMQCDAKPGCNDTVSEGTLSVVPQFVFDYPMNINLHQETVFSLDVNLVVSNPCNHTGRVVICCRIYDNHMEHKDSEFMVKEIHSNCKETVSKSIAIKPTYNLPKARCIRVMVYVIVRSWCGYSYYEKRVWSKRYGYGGSLIPY